MQWIKSFQIESLTPSLAFSMQTVQYQYVYIYIYVMFRLRQLSIPLYTQCYCLRCILASQTPFNIEGVLSEWEEAGSVMNVVTTMASFNHFVPIAAAPTLSATTVARGRAEPLYFLCLVARKSTRTLGVLDERGKGLLESNTERHPPSVHLCGTSADNRRSSEAEAEARRH